MNPRWFLRARHLVQHPPSIKQVKLLAGVIAFCLIVVAIERFWGWPAWMTADDMRRGLR